MTDLHRRQLYSVASAHVSVAKLEEDAGRPSGHDLLEAFALIGSLAGLDRMAVAAAMATRATKVDDYEAAKRDGRVREAK